MNLIRLAVVAAVFMGWQVFKDGPLAYYIAAGLLIAALACELAFKATGKAWAVYALCAFEGITTSACGGLFASGADARHFLCDEGTGLPVSLLSCIATLLVAVYLVKGTRNA